MVLANLEGGGWLTGRLLLGDGILDNSAITLGDTQLVHEELDALGYFGSDEAFFEIGHGTVVATDDFS